MKKSRKMLLIISMILLILIVLGTTCFAKVNTGSYALGKLEGEDEPFDMAKTIVGALQIVGTVVAVLGIIIIGIKYMMGSVEQKAEYKKTLIPYIVGCLFIFAIPTIVSILYSLATQINY